MAILIYDRGAIKMLGYDLENFFDRHPDEDAYILAGRYNGGTDIMVSPPMTRLMASLYRADAIGREATFRLCYRYKIKRKPR